MNTPLTRRRFFAIAALTAAGATAPFLLNRNRPTPLPTTGEPVIWKGIALGSGAELRLFGVACACPAASASPRIGRTCRKIPDSLPMVACIHCLDFYNPKCCTWWYVNPSLWCYRQQRFESLDQRTC